MNKDQIDAALNKYLPSEKDEPRAIHKAMRYSVFSGGKRLRPIIAIESAKACGGRPKDIVPLACAVELVHAYSLIHDDLPSMDDDDYRRGKPSCHKAFGEANAILAGDALLTLAFNIISGSPNPKLGSAAVRELSRAIGTCGIVGGQALDLMYKDRRKDKRMLERINRLKTSKLFEGSARLGAMAAGSNAKEIKAMAAFGSDLGAAFQIVDDIIDRGDYVRTFGPARARRDAEQLIERAKSKLAIFGAGAKNLKAIADCILSNSLSYQKHEHCCSSERTK